MGVFWCTSCLDGLPARTEAAAQPRWQRGHPPAAQPVGRGPRLHHALHLDTSARNKYSTICSIPCVAKPLARLRHAQTGETPITAYVLSVIIIITIIIIMTEQMNVQQLDEGPAYLGKPDCTLHWKNAKTALCSTAYNTQVFRQHSQHAQHGLHQNMIEPLSTTLTEPWGGGQLHMSIWSPYRLTCWHYDI